MLTKGRLVVKKYGIKEIVAVTFILNKLQEEIMFVIMLAGSFQNVKVRKPLRALYTLTFVNAHSAYVSIDMCFPRI